MRTNTNKQIELNEMAEHVERILKGIYEETNRDTVLCMMGVIVERPSDAPVNDQGETAVRLNHFVVGDPEDIKRMMMYMLENSFELPGDSSEEQVH